MHTFKDLSQQHDLKPFTPSPLGQRYRLLRSGQEHSLVILHFTGDNASCLRAAYVDLLVSLQDWLNVQPELVWLAEVQQPHEIGQDFVSRLWHIYITSLWSYDEAEDPPEKPPQLDEMRTILRRSTGSPSSEQDAIIEAVLRRNLLEASSKTYPIGIVGAHNYFMIVEPRVTLDEVTRWGSLMG